MHKQILTQLRRRKTYYQNLEVSKFDVISATLMMFPDKNSETQKKSFLEGKMFIKKSIKIKFEEKNVKFEQKK
jgi:hypothetical protein